MAVAVVLAAGEGRRLGTSKALARLHGRTFVERVVGNARRAALEEILVVTGASAEQVEAEVERAAAADAAPAGEELAPVRCVRNDDWRAGRTGSLQAGWRAARAKATLLYWPVDHPAVQLVTLDLLLGVHGYAAAAPEVLVPVVEEGEPAAATPGADAAGSEAGGRRVTGRPPERRRRRGHPIVLSAALRDDVLALPPDARLDVFLREREILEVPVDDPGVLLNVNEPEDLARAERLTPEA